MKECSFLNGGYIPVLTAYEYRGYYISAWARPEFTNGYTSVGIVSKQNQLGSFVQVQRTEGRFFSKTKRSCMGWSYARNGLISREAEAPKAYGRDLSH